MSVKVIYEGQERGFRFDGGNAIKASDARAAYSKFHKDWGAKLAANNSLENHQVYAYRIIEPIDKVIEYEEWTKVFFHDETEDFLNPTFFAEDDLYTAMAWTISPDGGPTMLRPGTPVYTGISPQRLDTGLEFNIDQLRRVGWNLQERKVKEAGNELARKRNTLRKTLLDAAVPSANKSNSTGNKLQYSAIRTIMQSTADDLYKPTVLVMNPSRAWDMSEWTLPQTNSMWQAQEQLGEEVLLRNGFLTNIFGLDFFLFDTVPSDEVWLATGTGIDYDFIYMPLEPAVENSPLDRVTRYRWLEDRTSYVRDGSRYWKISIVA